MFLPCSCGAAGKRLKCARNASRGIVANSMVTVTDTREGGVTYSGMSRARGRMASSLSASARCKASKAWLRIVSNSRVTDTREGCLRAAGMRGKH